MNNSQFRRLLVDSPGQQKENGSSSASPPARTPGAVLGARKSSSIPMTPRQVGRSSIQADFARQLAERNAKPGAQKKQFRSAAPKGSKLVAGFTDRTKARVDDDDDERAKRIKNLEEAMKLGQIDTQTYEKLVQQITGGDIEATHLVKGLDRTLLQRVRKGEDVFSKTNPDAEEQDQEGEKDDDVEDEFDELAEKEVDSIVRDKVEKKGTMAPPKPVAGVKRSRADILAELKRQREEAAAAAAEEHEKKYPSLGKGFRKVNERGESSRIEIDKQGREVLIITDAHGKEKRKVKKQKMEDAAPEIRHDLDDEKKPINMNDLPAPKVEKEESDDDDIFEGVGSNYNPLADLNSDDDESEDEEGEAENAVATTDGVRPGAQDAPPEDAPVDDEHKIERPVANPTSTAPKPPAKRDYFANSKISNSKDETPRSEASAADATVRAALQKVRTLDPNSTLINDADSEEGRLKARLAKLAGSDRDMEDIDMGFGASRFDDAEEMEREGEKIKFSEWKGIGGDEDDEEEGGSKGVKKRKRGPKKKKGDKNSAADVLNVMERQKKTLG